MPREPKDATALTRASNRAVLDALPFADGQDFEDARRGFVATLPEVEIKNADGRVVWTLRDYGFLDDAEAPATVNPSLWRQARLNMHHGLFQVTDGIYQVRGFDISNMTILEADRGIVVIDPLISTEVARVALDLYVHHRGARPVTAVIYSHSHTDHYGGVRGVVDEADVRAGRVEIWAPDRFMHEVVSETVLAGTAMVRRAQFQFGATLPRGPRGQVPCGPGGGGAHCRRGPAATLRDSEVGRSYTEALVASSPRVSRRGGQRSIPATLSAAPDSPETRPASSGPAW